MIKDVMNKVIEALDEYQISEVHFGNKRTELTYFEVSAMNEATRKYRGAIIQAIDILIQELKEIER